MRDSKTMLLVMLSIGLVCTWVYHLYDKTIYSQKKREIFIKDSVAVAQAVQDSLQKIYAVTINDLDSRLDSSATSADSLKNELGATMQKIGGLRKEINSILGKKGATDADLKKARDMIAELQSIISGLREQNTSMEDEQKRLNLLMAQLNGDIQGLEQNMRKLGEENRVMAEKINLASVFIASELRLSPIAVKGNKEEETNQARKASKFVLSFTVQNNMLDYQGAEVFVIITGPDGKVLQNEGWEIREMETKNEGKKEYSLKVRFDYEKGEPKHHLFSLNSTKYEKGNYTMQVYHSGYRIGQLIKSLI